MDIMVEELKKIFIKRRVLLLWIFLLAVKMIYALAFADENGAVNLDLEKDKERYLSYLQEIEGKVDAKKDRELQKMFDVYNEEKENLLNAADRAYAGEISEEEYVLVYLNLKEKYGDYDAISVLQSQYEYVKEKCVFGKKMLALPQNIC